MDGAFVVRVAVVSGLAAVAFVLLRDGLSSGRAGPIGAGAATGVLALVGIIALVRIVVAAELRSRDWRS